ncbi:MAG: thiamine diphosphokinase [Synergistaceae bacterium]|jgi:thiamine pyrophosphokinase|nr:thiamine diphosphokinase [Synergistaceae bacterium]
MCDREIVRSRDLDIFLRLGVAADESDRTLFMLGGRPADVSWLIDFVERNSPDIWAIDSGVAACRAIGRIPSELIGDKDSSLPGDWIWALEGGAREHLHQRDKDMTDFQIAFDMFMDDADKRVRGERILMLSGCFGGRMDHLMSNLLTLALSDGVETSGERNRVSRCMIDEHEGVFLIYPEVSASIKFHTPPVSVSLLPMSDFCRGVSVSGVRWPLEDTLLRRGFPWAISNEVSDDLVSVRCEDGILALYWCFGI